MLVSDLDHLENLEPVSVKGGFSFAAGGGVEFNTFVVQDAQAFSAAISKDDAIAVAIAKNEFTLNFGDST
ncbi:MAG: hypothetical protein AAGF83_26015 [Cyanobacteria bacterium P01_G01_bin.67]